MKKLFITCALITSASVVSFAQTKQVSATVSMDANDAPAKPQAQPARQSIVEQMAERKAKTYRAQYGLTDDQYKKVYDAEYDFAKQEHEIKANGGQPGAGQEYQMQLSRDYKMKAIMTPAQYAKYEAANPKPQVPGPEKASSPAKKN